MLGEAVRLPSLLEDEMLRVLSFGRWVRHRIVRLPSSPVALLRAPPYPGVLLCFHRRPHPGLASGPVAREGPADLAPDRHLASRPSRDPKTPSFVAWPATRPPVALLFNKGDVMKIF